MQENLEGVHSLADLMVRFEGFEGKFFIEIQGDRVERVIEKWRGQASPNDWRIVDGARILDLGCGTALPDSCHVYPPYFSRLMALNGARVTGIDRFAALPEDTATFTHIQADIVDVIINDRLKDLFNIKMPLFDIIHTSRVIDVMEPFFDESLYRLGLTSSKFLKLLHHQAKELLVEGGLLAVENDFFRKKGDDFVILD